MDGEARVSHAAVVVAVGGGVGLAAVRSACAGAGVWGR